ncbi:MAG: FliH/SctL family protein [Solidesulfovibrio sp.]
MSLSDGHEVLPLSGRVILGPGTAETTVGAMEGERAPLQFEEVEAEFWDRVRTKVKAKASAIMAEAITESERLRATAQEEGYATGESAGMAAGMAAAGEQVQTELNQMAASLGVMLESLAGERAKLWAAYRQDFVDLLRLAVERTIGAEIDGRRQEILGHLLNESLELMEAKADLTVVVHPDDEPLLRELWVRAQQERPNLAQVMIRTNPESIPGGLTLESRDGLVDNTIGNRFAAVETIFAHLAAAEEPEQPAPSADAAPEEPAPSAPEEPDLPPQDEPELPIMEEPEGPPVEEQAQPDVPAQDEPDQPAPGEPDPKAPGEPDVAS